MKLIVGLGNPGPQYAHNRHNIGFQIVEGFAQKHQFPLRKMQFNAVTITGVLGPEKIILARPLTYMNDSGRAVGPLARWLKLALSDLLVVYDELDLPLGQLRLRPSGGSAGHNGMKSIIQNLGDENFPRLRVGVARPDRRGGADFLLDDFARDEMALVEEARARAIVAIEVFITRGLTTAMNQFNVDEEKKRKRVDEEMKKREKQGTRNRDNAETTER
jgi:PTH1 family peptidyl-tRNA hydrolase